MSFEAIDRQPNGKRSSKGSARSGDLEDWSEQALDRLMGEALLEGVRLGKVLRLREALLGGQERELVFSFSRDTVRCGATDC